MKPQEALNELKALGTAQNRKVYARHGVESPTYGVSFANLGKLKKKIGTHHEVALKLWASGNHDARVLAAMVSDPDRLDGKTLDAWVKDLDNYVVTNAFCTAAARSPHAVTRMRKWIKSRQEWIGCAGWDLLSELVSRQGELEAKELEGLVGTIEKKIHSSPNRVRHSMNQALICIGLRSAALEKKAIAAARAIGKVEVDHGATSCKTPDAIAYIQKTKAYHKKKAAKKAAKKATKKPAKKATKKAAKKTQKKAAKKAARKKTVTRKATRKAKKKSVARKR